MARFAGKVGFGFSTETSPGNFEDVITEKKYYGYVTRSSKQVISVEKINDDVVVENTIEIIADAFASENMFAMRYVEWGGGRWRVSNVEPQHPRLLLRLGGVYNGPAPTVP